MVRLSKLIRCIALLVAIILLPAISSAAEHNAPKKEPGPFPDALNIRIKYEKWNTDYDAAWEVGIPTTSHEGVNKELYAIVKSLWSDAVSHAPQKKHIEVEVMTTYRISGTKWAGFLITGRVIEHNPKKEKLYDTEQTTYLNCQQVTYDMETGERLTLSDVFPEGSEAWTEISGIVNDQLNAYYPGEERNADVVASYCDTESLRDMSFLPGAGRLLVTVPMWTFLENHHQLVQIPLPYPDFRSKMTKEAFAQTDNSARPIIALTYDDGPNRWISRKIIRTLGNYGASATFFTVGNMMKKWPDIPRRELDYGHAVGSHSYQHKYAKDVTADYIRKDRETSLELHESIVGIAPTLFRAPGGDEGKYRSHKIGWPLIHWCKSADDVNQEQSEALMASRVARSVEDGDIYLLHDVFGKTAESTELFMEKLHEKGFMFATVEELMYLHGIVPEPDTIYYCVNREPITPDQ